MIDIKKQSEILTSELNKVVTELKDIGVEDPTTHDWVAVPETSPVGEADPNVQADITEEWAERRAVLSQLETRYRNILSALKKIEDGSYGLCDYCHKEIEPARLEALPAAKACTAHMENDTDPQN